MKKVWILLANTCTAAIYEVGERERHFHLIKTLQAPENKLKESDLVSDRPGHYQKGHPDLRGSYEGADHKKLKIEFFAKEITQELEKGRTDHSYDSLIIIAEPYFYGLLNKHANHHIQNLIQYHLPKDYTYYSEKELRAELESKLAHEIRLLLLS